MDSSPWLRAWVRGAIEGLTSKPEDEDRPTVADLALHAKILDAYAQARATEAEAWVRAHGGHPGAVDHIEHHVYRHVPPGGVTDRWICACGEVLEQRAPLVVGCL